MKGRESLSQFDESSFDWLFSDHVFVKVVRVMYT
jgi:hypothetical protein